MFDSKAKIYELYWMHITENIETIIQQHEEKQKDRTTIGTSKRSLES